MGEGGSYDQPQDPCQVGRMLQACQSHGTRMKIFVALLGFHVRLQPLLGSFKNQSLRQIEVVKLVPGYALGD